MQIEDYKKVWLNWKVKYCCNRDCLLSSDFKIEEVDGIDEVRVPYFWVASLAEKYSWLHTLRNPSHIPENPWKLVDFIKQIEDSLP